MFSQKRDPGFSDSYISTEPYKCVSQGPITGTGNGRTNLADPGLFNINVIQITFN